MTQFFKEQVLDQDDLNWFVTLPDRVTLVDVYQITYEIQDINDPNNPITIVAETNAERYSVGHYYADWTVPDNIEEGDYRIIWKWLYKATSELSQGGEEFLIGPATEGSTYSTYITPDDLYNEGVSKSISSIHLQNLINFAQQYIERITGNIFRPVARGESNPLLLDGDDTELLIMPEPIIQIDSIAFKISRDNEFEAEDLRDFTVYNRELHEDKQYPRIKVSKFASRDIFTSSSFQGYFPEGTQNIKITGTFGWLENGKTPEPIKKAMVLLCLKWLRKLGTAKGRAQLRPIFLSQLSDGHSYMMSEKNIVGRLTGDATIDTILRYYSTGSKIGIA